MGSCDAVPACRSTGQIWVHAVMWEIATIVTFGLILGICYGGHASHLTFLIGTCPASIFHWAHAIVISRRLELI